MKHSLRVAVGFAALACCAGRARAIDGVKLLGQPRTFPIVISKPGSYRLKKNITVPDANTTAISVQADYVTIDLNGYSIQGPVVCTGFLPPSCSPSGGTGQGIVGNVVTVRNGSVHGMGDRGIGLALEVSRVENVTAQGNGGTGISAGTVTGSVAFGNGGEGISATTVSNSTADGNGQYGIVASTVSNCTAISNFGGGIYGATAIGCTASSNGTVQMSVNGITGHNICNSSPCP